MTKIKLFTLFALLVCLLPFSNVLANSNTIVQSYSKAMRNDMYEPGFHKNTKKTKVQRNVPPAQPIAPPVIAVSDPEEKPINFNKELASSIFTEETAEPISMELTAPSTDLKIKIGQPLEIILPEDGNAKWVYENSFKNVQLTNDYYFDGKKILNFEIINKGEEKIYFDSFVDDGGNIKVIESRVLNITAR